MPNIHGDQVLSIDPALVLDDDDLSDVSHETQQHAILMIDDSGSMSGEPSKQVEKGLNALVQYVKNDPIARNRFRISIITYSDDVHVLHSAARPEDIGEIALSAYGATSMGHATKVAIQEVEELKSDFKANGIDYNKPFIINLTDGQPTDWQEFEEATDDILIAQTKQQLTLYTFGCNGADLSYMKRLALSREPQHLEDVTIEEFFENLSVVLVSGEDIDSAMGNVAYALPS